MVSSLLADSVLMAHLAEVWGGKAAYLIGYDGPLLRCGACRLPRAHLIGRAGTLLKSASLGLIKSSRKYRKPTCGTRARKG